MAAQEPTTKEWIDSLIQPGQLLAWAMSFCYEAVFQRREILAPLLQTRKLRDEAFGRFWVTFSTNREDAQSQSKDPQLQPLPVPSKHQSSDLIPAILAQASGIVLDVGPGTGSQMPLLRSPAIKAIYGAEPCQGLHAELRNRAEEEGLGAKYHVVPCSVAVSELIPALQKEGLNVEQTEGVFDSIICVRVLCSVPNMDQTIRDLYALLRPGGKLLITEHVVNPWRTPKGSIGARVAQAVYMFLGWKWALGDCCLDRNTEAALRKGAEKDGGWESVELDRWFEKSPMPYIAGVLVKKTA